MPDGRLYPDDDLLGFAKAVGNFSDVAAEAAAEPDAAHAPGGIFDVESHARAPAPEPPEETPAERHPDTASPSVLVPVLGMRMSVDEVDLGYARLIRAGALDDAPHEVLGAAHNVFAAIDCGHGPQAPIAASEGLARVVTTLRLLKPGGVGLAAHGWNREATTWRRFSTGAASPRPGGFELSRAEGSELVELSQQIARRSARTPSFAWVLSRFDLGAERPNQVEALSDYLLAVRALLEGGGPAKAALSARVGALCAGPGERQEIRETFAKALRLERKLMSGDRLAPGDASPIETIATVESILRLLLRGIVTGELGSDLRVTADEILLADGLSVGAAPAMSLGGTAEWRVADEEETGAWRIPDLEEAERVVAERGELTANFDPPTPTDEHETTPDLFGPRGGLSPPRVEDTPMQSNHASPAPPAWLEDNTERELEWPSFAGPRPKGRKRRTPQNDRVKYLFPEVDDVDWSVGELGADRSPRSA
ncbi:MAG: hypothetical protein ABR536_02675 [Solirubrobacterales bacterium]